MSTEPVYLKPVPDWEEHEKPTLPGSPSVRTTMGLYDGPVSWVA